MRLLKYVNYKKLREIEIKEGKDTKKKKVPSVIFMLETDNKKLIAVKPVFKDDWDLLEYISELKVIKSDKDDKDLPF